MAIAGVACARAPAAANGSREPVPASVPMSAAPAPKDPSPSPSPAGRMGRAPEPNGERMPVPTGSPLQGFSYMRTGGFAPRTEKLVFDGKTFVASSRGQLAGSHPASTEDRRTLEQLVHAALATPVRKPDKAEGQISDAFEASLTLEFQDGTRQVIRRQTLTFPPNGMGPAWDKLMAHVDGLLGKSVGSGTGSRLPSVTE